METIQALAAADAPEIEQILSRVQQQSAVPVGPKWSSSQIAEECRGAGWILRDAGGRLRAFILLRDAVDAWEITFLATSPDAQRCGYMRKLLSHLLSSRPKNRALWLEVHEANSAARQLYQSVGFREVGRRPKYYSDGGAAILYNHD